MEDVFLSAIDKHRSALDMFEASGFETIRKIVEMVIGCIENDGCIYLCGNGGSTADSQHVAGELVGRYRQNRQALPAVALTADSAVITCIGNDFGYDEIFSRQVDALVTDRDILWAFSTSGTSSNILTAVDHARDKGAQVIGFTGKPDTPLENRSDICLCSGVDETNIAQEIHQIAYHLICDLIEQHFVR